ncbi:MAG: hypothetical protein RIR79_1718 [Pseudomonadota bacterium]|jgi:hypothetical protein
MKVLEALFLSYKLTLLLYYIHDLHHYPPPTLPAIPF